MSNEEKERRCKTCGKLLLDEKLPFCRRCVLEGRNKVGQVGGILGSLAMMVAYGASKHINNRSCVNDDTTA